MNNYLFLPIAILLIAYAIHKKKNLLYLIIPACILFGEILICQSRSHFIGIIGFIIFIFWYLYKTFDYKRKYPVIITALTFILIISFFNDAVLLKSFFMPRKLLVKYSDSELKSKHPKFHVPTFVPHSSTTRAYEPNETVPINPPVVYTEKTARGNILFRIFIWKDMVRDMIKEKAWLGMNWGHKQYSPTLYALRWGNQIGRGWITPHNSWIHIIYRAGILGVLLTIFGITYFIKLTQMSIKRNDIISGLLLGIIVYWSIVACFTVFLELPYNAIGYWSLIGIIIKRREL